MSNEQTIENLNKALQMEMSAAHQYQLHAHVLEDWGLTKLAQQMRKEMQEELGHSDRFIERIMFLKGNPHIAFQKPPHSATSICAVAGHCCPHRTPLNRQIYTRVPMM